MVSRRMRRGLLVGSLAGVALGAWLIPRLKPETRQQIREKSLEIALKAGNTWQGFRSRFKNNLHRDH